MGPIWRQVGSKLAQIGVMLGPSLLQVGSSWAMLAPSWLPLKTIHAKACPTSENHPCECMPYPSSGPQVGSMLAPCWLMLAPIGSILAHVGPSGLQDGSAWLQVGTIWFQDTIMMAQVGLKTVKMASNKLLFIFYQNVFNLEHPGPSK